MLARVLPLLSVLGGAAFTMAAVPAGGSARSDETVAGFHLIQAEKKEAAKDAETGNEPATDAKAEPQAEPPPKSAPPPKSDPEAARDSILKKLSHDEYRQRLAAQDALLEWGKRDIDQGIEALYEIYRNSDDPEVRLRSREVLRHLVIIKQPFEGSGYLGIQMEPGQWKGEDGELRPAVRITIVRKGTAAEVAKLQADDLVTGVDEVAFNPLTPTRSFADYIQSKKPGDVITLHVKRGEETLHLKASLRRRSPLLNRLTQWGTQLNLPAQSELDEADFRDWLKKREAQQREDPKGGK